MKSSKNEENSILVADDHLFMRKVLKHLLTINGYTNFEMVSNGAEALYKLKRNPYRILITDLEMKPIDGFALIREIRCGNVGCSRDLPVLVTTGHSASNLVTRCLMLDIHGFLVKPISPEDMAAKIKIALAREIPLKAVGHYEKIVANWSEVSPAFRAKELDMAVLDSMQEITKKLNDSEENDPDEIVKTPLPIGMLEAGMTLAEHILTQDRAVLVKANSEITSRMIEVLDRNSENLFSNIVEVYLEADKFRLLSEVYKK